MKRTDNLDLPIFEQNDRPTWLNDVNDAMRKIDAGYADNVGDAGEAKAIAAEAKTIAESAQTSASGAVETATAAQTTAETAVATANRAELNASNAYTTAQTASTTATNAQNAVSTAQTTAEDAATAAAAAQSTANAANTAASAAQTAATQAANDAGTAQTAASAAQTAASAAQTQAQTAASSAAAAQAAASASAGRIDRLSAQKRTFAPSFNPSGNITMQDLIDSIRGYLISENNGQYHINTGEQRENKIKSITLIVPNNDDLPDYHNYDIWNAVDFSIGTAIDNGITFQRTGGISGNRLQITQIYVSAKGDDDRFRLILISPTGITTNEIAPYEIGIYPREEQCYVEIEFYQYPAV